MAEETITVHVQKFDKTKKARVTLPATLPVSELLAECRKNWALPSDVEFAVRDASRNLQLDPKHTLAGAGVSPDTILEVFPLHEAGEKG